MGFILTKFKNLFRKEDTTKWYFTFIYLIILLIPLNHKEAFSVIDPDLVFTKYLLTVIAFIGVSIFAKSFKTYIKDPFFLFLLSFVFFQALSLFQSQDITSSLRFIAFQIAITFSYIPVREFLAKRKEGLRDLTFLYALGFIPIFLFLLLQVYLQTNHGKAIGGVWPVPGYPTRYGATFWDVNHFGAFSAALILILAGYVLSKKVGLFERIFVGIIIIAALVALFLTGSRSSGIGFLSGLVVFIILYFKSSSFSFVKNFDFRIQFLSVVAAIFLPLFLVFQLAEPIKQSLLYRSVSFFSHLFLLKVGIIVGLQNFLFGIGVNSFHAYFRQTEWADVYYYIDRAALDLKLPLHNLWLEVLAETGVVSFILFVGFWVLLLAGLYRLLQKNRDILALGFLSGLVVFLVGGFMYSYKSEFFWFFVLIASAYVSSNFFAEVRAAKIKSQIKKILCNGECDLTKLFLFILSFGVLLLPTIFITHPLSSSELSLFYGGYESSLIVDKYSDLLMLFRYVIGNYTYSGRLVSVLFYFGSISLLFLVVNRYVNKFLAFVIVAFVFGIANILEPNLVVSIKYYLAFVILAVVCLFLFVTSFVRNSDEYLLNLSKISRNKQVLVICLLLITLTVGVYRSSVYFEKSNSEDLTFLLELSYNRGLMDKALIQVTNKIDLNLAYYFADQIQYNESTGVFKIQEGTVVGISGLDLENFNKNLFIYHDKDDDVANFINTLTQDERLEVTHLRQGGFNVVLVEVKASVLAAYSQ